MSSMEKFIRITNKDQKVWILPCRNLRTALCLYQPSSTKGKALKRMLPSLIKFPVVFRLVFSKLGIQKQKEGIPEDLRKYLSEVYADANNIQFSAFLGTPGTHQKVTVQISKGDKILGYCKVTENPEIYSIFQHEQMVLEYLSDHGIASIPRCIRCEALGDNKYVFVQTTVKTLNSDVRHELGPLELEFIHQLAENTKVTMDFKQTDFFQSIQRLQEGLGVLKENGFHTYELGEICRNVTAYYQNHNRFSAYHRDFTPWNSFVENGKLFVFDFEYAALQYPAYLDAIHYLFQTAIFEKNMTAPEIYALYRRECDTGALNGLFEHSEIALQSYLVDMISLYLSRGESALQDDGTVKLLAIWTDLCGYVLLNG